MLSRWYAIFLGILLLVLGVAGLIAPRVLGFGTGALVTTSVIWLITAVVALWYGFGVRNLYSLRWFAIVVGGLYLLWGIVQMAGAPQADTAMTSNLLASLSGLMVLLGSIGLAAGLVPMTVSTERETMMPGSA
jgi:hypothetical protein